MGTISNKMFIEMLYKFKTEHQQKFLSKLVPTIDINNILGVKNPDIRKNSKRSIWEKSRGLYEIYKSSSS